MSGSRGRVLAVDLGEPRIGLAVSDPGGILAQPLATARAIGPRRDVEQVALEAERQGARTVVVGLPLLRSGEEGTRARAAREFAQRLGERLGPAIQVTLWDERLTSVQAERTLLEGNVRRQQRRLLVDRMAA